MLRVYDHALIPPWRLPRVNRLQLLVRQLGHLSLGRLQISRAAAVAVVVVVVVGVTVVWEIWRPHDPVVPWLELDQVVPSLLVQDVLQLWREGDAGEADGAVVWVAAVGAAGKGVMEGSVVFRLGWPPAEKKFGKVFWNE